MKEEMQRRPQRNDPDHAVARTVARKVGIRVALLSAVMVVVGVLLLLSYLWVDDQQRRPHRSHESHGMSQEAHSGRGLEVELEADDIVRFVPIVGLAVIVFAGGGAMLFARQAVKPLEESLRRQRHFVGDASHELRTPLAVLDARIQQLQFMAEGNAELAPVLSALREDSKSMTDIVSDLLAALSEPDAAFEPAPLVQTLENVRAEMSLLAAARDIDLRVVSDPSSSNDPRVAVPETALRRSVLALIDNAIGYTRSGGSVTIASTVSTRWAVVRVIDEGPGITGIEAERIFERFARGAQPQDGTSRDTHGIGLALVREVATRYGGAVSVESTGSLGTVIRLQLPVARKGSPSGS